MVARLPDDRPQLLVEARLPEQPAAAVVVTMAGEIDRDTCAEVQRVVVDILHRARPERVSLDMRQVTFMDAAGIRALLTCRRHALQLSSVVEISRAHDNVRQVLAMTSLLDMFNL